MASALDLNPARGPLAAAFFLGCGVAAAGAGVAGCPGGPGGEGLCPGSCGVAGAAAAWGGGTAGPGAAAGLAADAVALLLST